MKVSLKIVLGSHFNLNSLCHWDRPGFLGQLQRVQCRRQCVWSSGGITKIGFLGLGIDKGIGEGIAV